ncbi:helix-turn-helix transcriptional regulator [Enteractinococcus coprophilus]|uniref:Regulatory LuxR family protein n=1 Tax=Enteractinococcus coprophilus TaxID=1027633 RepID=A0A543AGN9_9MICC|nr:LuxR C-terminal-related transcriptional regulator [Enteractinococcus coprophilus]TQL71727.1 regulatory LuxR family protein [Enteractinococcus coprophilus]
MQDADNVVPDESEHDPIDGLAQFVQRVEQALAQQDYALATSLIEGNFAATWFGFARERAAEILELLAYKVGDAAPLTNAAYKILVASHAGHTNTQALQATFDENDPKQMFAVAMFRMSDYRIHGMTDRALEQADMLENYLSKMHPTLNARDGLLSQTPVQIGITATLAGDFSRALTSLMQAQLRPANSYFVFLEREALVQSALIHATFGNAATASGLLTRATQVPRTSSWVEQRIDVQADFADILLDQGAVEDAIDRFELISLHDVGETWPFYVVVLHRLLEAAGYHDELEHRLEMLDSLPLARKDGEGFTGSVLPLKRALVALSVGRGSEAVRLLERADHSLTYTKLVRAATDIYVGRLHHALEQIKGLQNATRGFRLLELRRLSVLAAGHYMLGNTQDSIRALDLAAHMPRGLNAHEKLLFGPEIQEFAEKHVPLWPNESSGNAIFLPRLPKRGHSLTDREIEILEHLTLGLTRTEIAEQLFVSLSTIKTQLQSIYRKLGVSSAADAVIEGERRGII